MQNPMAQYMWPGLISEVIMQIARKDLVTLNMFPVCECGTVIPDVEVELETIENNYGYKSLKIHFYPFQCPNCGAHIDGLQMDGKYVDMFMRR